MTQASRKVEKWRSGESEVKSGKAEKGRSRKTKWRSGAAEQ
jgi:hypothetical protein